MKSLTVAVVLVLFAGLAIAEENLPARVVRVIGTGEVRVPPDRAVIEVGVEKQDVSAKTAKQLADAAAQNILARVRENGVDEKDVQTVSFSLGPEYDYHKGRRLTGFTAHQTLSITVRDLAKLDSLLESLIQAGGNQISSLEYETSDMRKYRDQARDLAVKAAREKAESLASSLGQGIGKAFSIEEVPESAFQSSATANYSTQVNLMPRKSPSTAPGQNTISATVVVSFELN